MNALEFVDFAFLMLGFGLLAGFVVSMLLDWVW